MIPKIDKPPSGTMISQECTCGDKYLVLGKFNADEFFGWGRKHLEHGHLKATTDTGWEMPVYGNHGANA